jgi:hypothetical protein
MRIRYKTTSAGPQAIFHKGDIADVPDATGVRLIAGGFAEAVGVPAVAKVVKEAVKQTVKPAKKTTKKDEA